MAGWTNRGKNNILDAYFRGATIATNFYIALLTNDTPPTADTETLGGASEIAAGNGYTAGGGTDGQLDRNSTDFDVLTEDDTNDRALIQIKDVSWTASGGNIPASGNGARWAALLDDNVTVASRELEQYWDLISDRTISSGQSITLQDLEMRVNES